MGEPIPLVLRHTIERFNILQNEAIQLTSPELLNDLKPLPLISFPTVQRTPVPQIFMMGGSAESRLGGIIQTRTPKTKDRMAETTRIMQLISKVKTG